MIVNIEFLDYEPIENVISSLHFKFDKTIFFGFSDVIEERKEATKNFLKKYCGVKEVSFVTLPEYQLDSILSIMRNVVEQELNRKNDVFFEVTGGESLILIAFGMLAESFRAPMHSFDIETQKLIELNRENVTPISEVAPRQNLKMNLDMFIEMQGGKINYRHHKGSKNLEDPEFEKQIEALWEVSSKYGEKWNFYADFLRRCCGPDEALKVDITGKEVLAAYRKIRHFQSIRELGKILGDCAATGVFEDFVHTKDRLSFKYKDEKIKDILWDAGSILEMHTFMEERKNSDDCMVGVHLDWDGIIYNHSLKDTLNEIDVLSLKGVIPTFISCKNGSVNQMALYELKTVADRFGGKYARKVIAAPQGLNEPHSLRAKAMDIEVRT